MGATSNQTTSPQLLLLILSQKHTRPLYLYGIRRYDSVGAESMSARQSRLGTCLSRGVSSYPSSLQRESLPLGADMELVDIVMH